jgi:hypothetical protein
METHSGLDSLPLLGYGDAWDGDLLFELLNGRDVLVDDNCFAKPRESPMSSQLPGYRITGSLHHRRGGRFRVSSGCQQAGAESLIAWSGSNTRLGIRQKPYVGKSHRRRHCSKPSSAKMTRGPSDMAARGENTTPYNQYCQIFS